MDFRSCKQRFSKVKKLKAHFWWVPMVVHLLIFFFFWGFWGCFWFFVVLCCSYELGDSKEKAAATTYFVKPLPVEKEKRKKHTHTCTHRVGVVIDHRLNCLLSWMCCCCCSSTIVECLPCSTCYIYVCNASQNLSIFRSHRGWFDIEIRIFHLSWEKRILQCSFSQICSSSSSSRFLIWDLQQQ